ncbi:MAG TPA: arginine--tRNA ligase [Clostridiales bacterium]|nr:arginine--tRNA ligase [Clostridiales bacterium]
MDTKSAIVSLISKAISTAFPDVPAQVQDNMLEVPPDASLGDYAFPCFRLAKPLRMAPPKIAEKLAQAIYAPEVATVVCTGGYLNFFLNRRNFAEQTLTAIAAVPGRWGASDMGAGQTVCIDYSSVNIAKRFHIGHLPSTVIGNSLKRIYDFLGYRTVGINHLGDWGTQFGKMIAAFKHWGDEAMIESGSVQALQDLYVRFHREAEANPALEDEGRAWFKRIEEGDPEAMRIFEAFKDMTLKDVERVYKILDVQFDSYKGESFYNDKMDRVIDELRDKGLLVESDGAWVVDLEEHGMPPCLILKSDGATLYATRDIAAALYRKDTYDFYRALYVVAYQQDLHFRQVFKVLELMGYPWAAEALVHVSFGMVSFEGQAFSTRAGNVLYLDDLLERAQEKALDIINEKSPDLADKASVARDVGVGALVFSALYNNRIKDVDFWWDRALNFDGETGPYVQYTHARCCSVLRKAEDIQSQPDYEALTDDEAQALLRLLSRFPEAVIEAAQRYEPSVVTRAVTEIAKAYNKYYYEHRILDGDNSTTAARLMLTQIVRDVIQTGLQLIGLKAPERM